MKSLKTILEEAGFGASVPSDSPGMGAVEFPDVDTGIDGKVGSDLVGAIDDEEDETSESAAVKGTTNINTRRDGNEVEQNGKSKKVMKSHDLEAENIKHQDGTPKKKNSSDKFKNRYTT